MNQHSAVESKPRILYIDSNAHRSDRFREEFHQCGAEVVHAADFKQAYGEARAHAFDVVAIRPQDIDGIPATAFAKALNNSVPLVGMCSDDGGADAQSMAACGVIAHISSRDPQCASKIVQLAQDRMQAVGVHAQHGVG